MNPTVFLGLVTHRRSRFPMSASTDGLVRRLGQALTERGIAATVEVHSDDHHDESLVPLTQANVRASIDAELALEKRWRAHVDPGTNPMVLSAAMAARRAVRTVRLAPPWHSDSAATAAGATMIRRLVNIELAHLHLLRRAQTAGADWVLIAEDDADLADVNGFASALTAFMERQGVTPQPSYVNVSRSFSHADLGLSSHLTDVGTWSTGVRMQAADRPLTNTVCAVLYRGAFLTTLIPALEDIPMTPVVPIDWKLNAALLSLHAQGELGSGDCWFLDPAPIVQGSMHAPSD